LNRRLAAEPIRTVQDLTGKKGGNEDVRCGSIRATFSWRLNEGLAAAVRMSTPGTAVHKWTKRADCIEALNEGGPAHELEHFPLLAGQSGPRPQAVATVQMETNLQSCLVAGSPLSPNGSQTLCDPASSAADDEAAAIAETS
jgi:hypothetical protein